jgi:hypothetical protein
MQTSPSAAHAIARLLIPDIRLIKMSLHFGSRNYGASGRKVKYFG